MMVFRAAPWWLEPGSLRCRQLTRELGGQITKMPVSSIYGRCGVTRTLHATPGYTKDPGVLLQQASRSAVRVSGCRRRVKVNWNRITNRLCEVGAGVCGTTTGPAPASGWGGVGEVGGVSDGGPTTRPVVPLCGCVVAQCRACLAVRTLGRSGVFKSQRYLKSCSVGGAAPVVAPWWAADSPPLAVTGTAVSEAVFRRCRPVAVSEEHPHPRLAVEDHGRGRRTRIPRNFR